MKKTPSGQIRLPVVIAGLICTLAFAPARALDCENASTTIEMSQCEKRAYEVADAELNEVYKALRASLDETGKSLLKDAQLAWIKFRDAECARQVDYARGGSIVSVIYPGCLAQMTRARIEDLRINPLTTDPPF
ncbi:lysozyme inhibitor LprI family protein [uncultured Cohaesibacter sp.]|uniref:lysozyme inhibitor LprI family protein n=1 Tax=uncultured Cohaesibacter sp. TaxID=1002546 RepID=UPI002930305C|nr:lysozyme inhibitor LprI family protein [uncultured Cohaesibacter sp.]